MGDCVQRHGARTVRGAEFLWGLTDELNLERNACLRHIDPGRPWRPDLSGFFEHHGVCALGVRLVRSLHFRA